MTTVAVTDVQIAVTENESEDNMAVSREEQEAPICMVADPDREKYRKFSLSIDSCLAKWEVPPVHWRTLWIHLCKKAMVTGDKELLGALIELYNGLEENGGCNEVLEALRTVIG